MSEHSDAELWHRLQAADEWAFRELFLRHRDALYTFAFRRTASWATAEDVTQATFAALWRRAQDARLDARLTSDSARPVLYAMARGECANARRSQRRQAQLLDQVAAREPTADDDTGRWIEAETTMADIRRLLARLPARQRDVVELVAWAELSLPEAAAVLEIPVGTVKSRLSRARQQLLRAGAATLLRPTGGSRES